MVNSGAIMSASILLHLIKKEMNMAQKYDYVFSFFKRMAGGEYLGFNNSIFLSERDTADRNFALAYFLRENDCFPPPSPDINIPDILDFYFQVINDLLNLFVSFCRMCDINLKNIILDLFIGNEC